VAEGRFSCGGKCGAAAVWAAAVWAGAAALALDLPSGARLAAETVAPAGRVVLPSGPSAGGEAESLRAEGRISQRAWQLPADDEGAFALFARLRAGLVAEGFGLLFDCSSEECGGFDFRHGLDLLPEPDMHVDLGEFHYLLAAAGEGEAVVHVALFVSRSPGTFFVQETRAEPRGLAAGRSAATDPAGGDGGAGTAGERPEAPDAEGADGATGGGLARSLTEEGRVALDDLVFASGTAELGPGRFASLEALAAYLAANPSARIVLVGHTDATGALEANIALSRRRAQSVAERLVADFGADGARIGAEGAGYLAPRASNLTEAGRQKNRRVEAMLAPTRP
jgi:OOP family OmpA-OmpF porin